MGTEKVPHLHFHCPFESARTPCSYHSCPFGAALIQTIQGNKFWASKVDRTSLALIWRCIRPDLLLYSHMQLLPEIFWQQCGGFEAETNSSEKSAASNNIGLAALWVAKQCRGHLISLFSGPYWKLTEEEKGEEEFAVAVYGTVNRLTAALLGLWST